MSEPEVKESRRQRRERRVRRLKEALGGGGGCVVVAAVVFSIGVASAVLVWWPLTVLVIRYWSS